MTIRLIQGNQEKGEDLPTPLQQLRAQFRQRAAFAFLERDVGVERLSGKPPRRVHQVLREEQEPVKLA
ncbi:MAG: hypothetical protein NTZ46_02235 [Verrucomicrobia bacterium]|nr:hypothetical protein [Verrucomicrobiota bacterium]